MAKTVATFAEIFTIYNNLKMIPYITEFLLIVPKTLRSQTSYKLHHTKQAVYINKQLTVAQILFRKQRWGRLTVWKQV